MADYISKINNIPIGGNAFDGSQWNSPSFAGGATMTNGQTRSFDISGVIPNDGHDYEVNAYCYSTTPSVGWNTISMGQTGTNYTCVTNTFSGPSSNKASGQGCTLPIYSDLAKTLNVYNACGSGTTTGNIGFGITTARRLGKNDTLSNRVEKIATPDGTRNVKGDMDDGAFVYKNVMLLSGVSLKHATTDSARPTHTTYDISSHIPNDGHGYFVYLRCWGQTPSTNGISSEIHVANTTSGNYGVMLGRNKTRGGSWAGFGGNGKLYISPSNKKITVVNWGSVSSTAVNTILSIQLVGIQRCANNDLNYGSQNKLEKINGTYNFGGSIFSGRWTRKNQAVIGSTTTFNDSSTVTRNYTLSNYLPDNTYYYEVLGYCQARTNATAGTQANFVFASGGSVSIAAQQLAFERANEARRQACGVPFTLIVKQSGGTLTFPLISYSSKGEIQIIQLLAYRRIGTAGTY